MKKIILFIILLLTPILVSAKEYTVFDLTSEIPSSWEIYTRDNVIGNEVLKQRGIDGKKVLENMENSFMYIDMFRVEGAAVVEGFLFVKEVGDSVMNLNKFEDDDVLDVGRKAYGQYNPDVMEVYKHNDYKYVYVKYLSSLNGATYEVIDYYTVINGRGYTYQFQCVKSLEVFEAAIHKVIDNTTFKIEEEYQKSPYVKPLMQRIIIPLIMVIAVVFAMIITFIITRKNNKVQMTNQVPQPMMDQFPQQPNVMNTQVFTDADVDKKDNDIPSGFDWK